MGGGGSDDRVQREATSVLQHLFRFGSHRRTDARGRAVNYTDAALTVVDGDDILTSAPGSSLPPRTEAVHETEPAEDFPSLPGQEHVSIRTKHGTSKAYPATNSKGNSRGGGADFPKLGASSQVTGPPPKATSRGASGSGGRGRGGPVKQSLHAGPKGWGPPR